MNSLTSSSCSVLYNLSLHPPGSCTAHLKIIFCKFDLNLNSKFKPPTCKSFSEFWFKSKFKEDHFHEMCWTVPGVKMFYVKQTAKSCPINVFGWQLFWNLILKLTEMLWTSCIVNIWLLQGKILTNGRYFSVKMQDPINPNTSNAITNCTIPNTTTVTIRDQKWSVLKRYLGFHCCLKPPVVTERIFTWPAKTNVKEYFHDLQRQISKNIYMACKDKCQNTHYFKI